jgi:DNA-binding NarL/FixJ family response regulator
MRCATADEPVDRDGLADATHTDEGLRAAAEIRANHSRTGVLVLSQHVEPEYAARLDTFIGAVARMAAGGTAFDSEVISALVAGQGHRATERLTEREVTVLSLMAEGLSNAANGRKLYLNRK